MYNALYVAATGMQAQQLHVDAIANNLANMNTVAFKRGRVGFTELMAAEAARATEPGLSAPAAARTGAGVAVTGIARLFDPGELKKTEAPLDVAIQGNGFLEVTLADGSTGYTRGGSLKVNRDGLLATPSGRPLKAGIHVPDNAEALVITPEGRVQARLPRQAGLQEIGQLELARFANPAQLVADGDNLYRASELSGEPISARPGEDGTGTLAQGFVEGSNVKMVDEMVNLMVAQRAYEASVKVVQASDEMLAMVNNLRK